MLQVRLKWGIISQKVFTNLFCKSEFPHNLFNLSFMLVITKDKSMDLCGNGLLQNDYINTLCETL